MPPLRPHPSPAHQQAVARRVALLDAELAAVRGGPPSRPGPDPDSDPDTVPGLAPWEPLPEEWATPDTHTRPRPPRGSAPIGEPAGAAVGAMIGEVPRPGRHASSRAPGAPGAPTGALAALVPETLRGRAGLGPAHLAVVAVVLGVGLALTSWWALRAEPEALPASAPVGALVSPSAPATSSAAPGTTPGDGQTSGAAAQDTGEVVVDVAGKVRRPGIAVLPAGSRVADALEAAGGARPGVDLSSLNLARVLVDGEQVLVGAPAVPGSALPPPGVPTASAPAAPGALVDLNTADLALLDTLPGVGPVTAQAILDWRTENGGFSAVEDLLDVSGIGEVTLAELTPLVTV